MSLPSSTIAFKYSSNNKKLRTISIFHSNANFYLYQILDHKHSWFSLILTAFPRYTKHLYGCHGNLGFFHPNDYGLQWTYPQVTLYHFFNVPHVIFLLLRGRPFWHFPDNPSVKCYTTWWTPLLKECSPCPASGMYYSSSQQNDKMYFRCRYQWVKWCRMFSKLSIMASSQVHVTSENDICMIHGS